MAKAKTKTKTKKRLPWYSDGLKFTCTQCGDCCRTHGDYRWVYLFPEDAKRLAAHFKLSRNDFLRQWAEKGPEGFPVVRWQKDACIFLGEKGCTVYEARPGQCRTWPFWDENLTKKAWKEEVVPFCPGAGEGRLYQIGEIRRIARGEGETGAKKP